MYFPTPDNAADPPLKPLRSMLYSYSLELGWDVILNDALTPFLPFLLFLLHLVVLPEMLYILGMRQVLLLCILAVVFLEMVYLILVLIVAVMAGPKPEVGQLRAFGVPYCELGVADRAGTVCIEDLKNAPDDIVFLGLCDLLRALVEQAVCAEDIVRRPLICAVKVVKGEEHACVEVADMMLLCNAGQNTRLVVEW